MGSKEELRILWGLARRINNMIFGYKPRGKDDRKRKRRKKRKSK